MNAEQLDDAAAKLEEVFTPAVKRLRVKQSTEVLLDSLFEGEDDAGPFVVRFEVTITRWAERREETEILVLCCISDRFSAYTITYKTPTDPFRIPIFVEKFLMVLQPE